MALAVALPACADDAVTLPEGWNTLRHRRIEIDLYARVEGEAGRVRPLSGIDGAPLSRHPDLPDLTTAYWDRPNGSDEPDGAHIDLVRIGPESCALALDGIYRGGAAIAGSFDFAELDRHLASVADVRGEGALLALDMSAPVLGCGAAPGDPDPLDDALARPDTWAEAAASVVRHAIGDASFEPGARTFPIAAVQLFRAAPGADEAASFTLFAAAARRVRAVALDVPITSPELTLSSPSDLTSGQPGRFLAFIAADQVPLDLVAVRAHGDPRQVQSLVAALAAHLTDLGLTAAIAVVGLAPPELELAFEPDSPLGLAHLGAHEMAVRIALQDLPVRWLVAGRGPWSPRAPPGDESPFIPSPYFDRDGEATPAFVARVPMRQLAGQTRVSATTDAGEGLTVQASLDAGKLSILIAYPASASGVSAVTYDLVIPELTLATFTHVPFRLAELDQSNRGVRSFFFSDLAFVPLTRGDLHLRRTLPVPGVHFIEIDRLLP